MLKKIFVVLIVLVFGLVNTKDIYAISTTVDNSGTNSYLSKFDDETQQKLKKYSTLFLEMDIEGVTKGLISIQEKLKNAENDNEKYLLLYIEEDLKKRLNQLTGLNIEKLDLFDKWLEKKSVDKLNNVIVILDSLKTKYKNNNRKLNIIHFLEEKTKNMLDFKKNKSCIYKGKNYPINKNIVNSKKSFKNGFETWLFCNGDKKLVLKFNYKKSDGTISKNNIYKGNDVISVHDKVYTADYLVKNYNTFNNEYTKKLVLDNSGNINLSNSNNIDNDDNNEENNQNINETDTGTIEKCDGEKPSGEGVFLARDEKNGKYITWTYYKNTKSDYYCSWKCLDGFEKDGNTCKLTEEECKENEFFAHNIDNIGSDDLSCIDKKELICELDGKKYFGKVEDELKDFCKKQEGVLKKDGKIIEFECSEDEVMAKNFQNSSKKEVCINKNDLLCEFNNKIYYGEDSESLEDFCREEGGVLKENGEVKKMECTEDEKEAASMHVSEWLPNGEPNFKCMSKDELTCFMNDMHHFAGSDHEITLFCDRHFEDGKAVLSRGDEFFCTPGKQYVYPISVFGGSKEEGEKPLGRCYEEGDMICEVGGYFYKAEADIETKEFCDRVGGELSGGAILDSYQNYLCNDEIIYGNTLDDDYICQAPLGTVSYTIMTEEEGSCIDIDNEVLKDEGFKNKFSKEERSSQMEAFRNFQRNILLLRKNRFENFEEVTQGKTEKEKESFKEYLDKAIKIKNIQKKKLEEKMQLCNASKLDSLGAKSVAKFANHGDEEGEEDKQCTTAGFFGESDDDEEVEQDITTEIERENVSNYLQYISDDACGGEFVMHRKLVGIKIDSMEIEASCKDKDEKSYEEDVIKEIKEFGGTDLLDWVVYIKVNEKPKDLCETGELSAKYCSSKTYRKNKAKREARRQKALSEWKKTIEECATDQDAKTIKACYIDNPHPDGQEVFAYKAIAALEYGLFEGSLVESDDFEVIQPTEGVFLNSEGEPCDGDGKPCNGDGSPKEEGEGEGEGEGEEGEEWEPYPDTGDKGIVKVDEDYEGKSFILDNDIFDPDWVIMLQSSIAVDKMGLSKLRGINISARDSNYKTARLYHSILKANGMSDVPIGLLNSHIGARINNVDAAKGIDRYDSFCLDNKKCKGKFDSVKLTCEILKKSKGKVDYIIGGNLQNFAAFLKEKNKCNGQKLAKEKLGKVIIATGWNSRTNGQQETNLSCPQCGKYQSSAINATKTVFNLTPKNVPVVIATIPGINWKTERPGDYFKNHRTNTAMHYILSVPRYGTFGDHGPSDTEALLYSVYGNKIDGKNFTKEVETCFNIKSNGAAVITNKKCNQFYLDKDTNKFESIQGAKLWEFMKK